ncbi:putative protease Do-like 14 [Salvia miltiorrhiza]|uniref:putative protease Do-like 14 n=1 Tax=Salvia miltiorrhiza TaxID=226208 RepID=UPI0025AB766A|nr:putative protease Do-like 14 [Salvia miltiorrhiza]XP_057771949.1 putative protease Do-like 14 [Salvia miltiorrhiza]
MNYFRIESDQRMRRRNETNVWQSDPKDSFQRESWDANNCFESFRILKVNNNLDIYAKRASLSVAPAVVAIRVYSGERAVCVGSGFILECNEQFQATILTSGTLFTAHDNLRVVVVLPNRDLCLGVVEVCDFHLNLAIVRIQAAQLLPCAKLGRIKDSVILNSATTSWQLRPQCDQSSVLLPGHKLMALGRHQDRMRDFMAAPGELSIEDCGFDCKELFYSTCRITKSGIGGPMINQEGEVVGVNFFHVNFTPFLPINIITKWLEHFKKSRDCRRLCHGMKLLNLYAVHLLILEKIIQKFPNLKQGVMVDEVTPNSPAESVGISSQDIIIECDGEVVEGCLQFFDLMWDKVGKRIDLVVARLDGSHQNFSIMVADINPTQFNRWPLPTPHKDPFGDGMFDSSSPASVLKLDEGTSQATRRNVASKLKKRKGKVTSQSKKRKGIHLNLCKRLVFS